MSISFIVTLCKSTEWEGVDWMHVAQTAAAAASFYAEPMNLKKNAADLLTLLATVRFSRRADVFMRVATRTCSCLPCVIYARYPGGAVG